MRARLLYTMALAMVLTAFGGIRAAEGDAPRRPGAGAGANNQANILLQHADELGLTADQKAKLEEFKKGAMSVLTDEQKKKAQEFLPARRAGAAGRAAATPKPDEKKPEEKKPEEPKAEEKK